MKGNTLCGGLRFPPNDFCTSCKHYLKNTICEAFPNGMPEDIWVGETKHENYVKGDHGIKFEKVKEMYADLDIEDLELIDDER